MRNVEEVRRTCLAGFRVDVARAGRPEEATASLEELTDASPDFRRLSNEGESRSHGSSTKQITRPRVGKIVLESSVSYVDGAEGLSRFVWSPVNEASADAVAQLVDGRG